MLNHGSVFPFFRGPAITCCSIRPSEVKTELEQSQMSRKQDTAALSQAREAQRKSEAISQKVTEEIAKLGRAMSAAMAGLGVTLGPMTPETLIEEVGASPAWYESLS
jgi:hypothetical protein